MQKFEILLSALCNMQIRLSAKERIIALAVLDHEISLRQSGEVTQKQVLRKVRKHAKPFYLQIYSWNSSVGTRHVVLLTSSPCVPLFRGLAQVFCCFAHVQFGVKFANRPRAVARQITRRAIGRGRQLRLHVALPRFRVKSPTADVHQRENVIERGLSVARCLHGTRSQNVHSKGVHSLGTINARRAPHRVSPQFAHIKRSFTASSYSRSSRTISKAPLQFLHVANVNKVFTALKSTIVNVVPSAGRSASSVLSPTNSRFLSVAGAEDNADRFALAFAASSFSSEGCR